MLCLFPPPSPAPDICAIFHMPVKSFCALASQHILCVTFFTNTVPLFCQSAVTDDLSGIHYVTCAGTGGAQLCSLPVLQCVYTCCSTLNFASMEYLLAWVCICTMPARSWVHLPAELEEKRCESDILCWRGHCFEEALSGVRTEFPAHSLQSPFGLWIYFFSIIRLAFPQP